MSKRRDEELQRFFDGELSSRRAGKVHARIVDNPDDERCLAALDQMGHWVREAADANADQTDFSMLWARVQEGIEAENFPQRSFFQSQLLRWGMGLTAAAAAAVLAVVLLNPLEAPRQRNDCMIESLEVGSGATSTIFTIDDLDADATTVVWLNEIQGD